jgi:hypothetical protein
MKVGDFNHYDNVDSVWIYCLVSVDYQYNWFKKLNRGIL